jgi:hypothetical protein
MERSSGRGTCTVWRLACHGDDGAIQVPFEFGISVTGTMASGWFLNGTLAFSSLSSSPIRCDCGRSSRTSG